jgi:glycosyltransferase involved in cell wall biosynthesis
MFLGDRIVGGNSAYSKVGFQTCTRLANMGHTIAHIPMGRANKMGKYGFGKVLVYPSGDNYFGEDVALEHYVDFNADLLITIKETWAFNQIYKHAINFVPMAVVDHSPISSAITGRLENAFQAIAISRHAQKELRQQGIMSHYIPHGVDLDVYKPMDKAACRKKFYLDPDAFVVGIVAMNRARKMIPRMLRGFKRFLELNPKEKIQMMLWTKTIPRQVSEEVSTFGVADVGVHLIPEIVELKLTNSVHWPRWEDVEKIGGLPEIDPKGGWDMVSLLNCFDVQLLCSGGEGFGMTLIEQQAVGGSVITTNYAAGPEQVGVGYVVDYNDYVVMATPGIRYALASIDGMAEALTKVLNADREKLARKARKFAERYDWNVIMKDYWKPFLDKCEEELHPLISNGRLTSW